MPNPHTFTGDPNKAISVNPRITQQGNNFTIQPLALEYARDNPKQITKDIGKI